MVEIKVRLDNDDHYKGGNTKEYIVVHDTGNVTDSDEGNANYFCTGKRDSSAHYFVDDDSITQVVLDNDCSFHCGDGKNKYGIHNRNSIGIELCRVNSTTTETTKNNAIDLIRMLMKKYNVPIEKVVRHYDASRKNCPSSMSANNWAKWNEFKNKLKEDKEMVDKDWYLWRYKDVAEAGFEAQTHYDNFGKAEGRSPVPSLPSDYNEGYYLLNNPDINDSVTSYLQGKGGFKSGADHWLKNYKEGRSYAKPQLNGDKEISDLKSKVSSLQDKINKAKNVLS